MMRTELQNIYKGRESQHWPMTLVQASIADNGASVVLIADRMLTRSLGGSVQDYESEGTSPKIYSRGNVGFGFAGISIFADMIASSIPESETNFDIILEGIRKKILEIRDSIIETMVQRLAGITAKKFFEDSNNLPEEIRNMVYSEHAEIVVAISCIVGGFDKNDKARLFRVMHDGDTYELTNFNVVSIGSGAPFSVIFFDQDEYDDNISEIAGVLFAYRAKKWAEAHTGVGSKTDILVLRKDKSKEEIWDEDDLCEKINKIYVSISKKAAKIEKRFLTKLVESSEGRLK